jgi:hypothetical protein
VGDPSQSKSMRADEHPAPRTSRRCNASEGGYVRSGASRARYTHGMPSDRIARVVERLLNEAEVAAITEDWAGLQASADEALGLDPANPDALALSDFGRTALAQVKDFSGVDANAATSTALRELGLERDQVEVRVVTRGHKGHWFLGGQLPALIRVSYRQPSNLPEGSPVSGRSARVADAILDQAETSVAERDWDRALTLVGYVKRLDAENADASALRNLIESRQHSGPGESFTGTLPSNLVQALDPGNADADSLEQPAEPRAPVESEAGVVTATSDSRGLPNKASQLQPESPTDSSGMTFGQAVSSAFDNYANFDSRAGDHRPM